MQKSSIDAYAATLQGDTLQRVREILYMWREDSDAAKLAEEADANEEHVHYHDYSESLITFGLHRGKTFAEVFRQHHDYARWANRQQTSKPPLFALRQVRC